MGAVVKTKFGSLFRDWPLKPLQEVAFFQEGPGLRKWQWTDCGMKVINVTNIVGDGTVNVENTERYISEEEFLSKYHHFAVEDGDIVVASSGNTYGKVGKINKSHLPLMMNTSVIRFHTSDPEQLKQDFLFAFLRSKLFKNQVESFVIGSAQPNFGPSHVKRMVIPCPPLKTQQIIGTILSKYDDLIDNNNRRIAIMENMANAIYNKWFINFKVDGNEFVDYVNSSRGEIPKGWNVKRLDEIVNLQSKGTKPGDHLNERIYLPIDCIPRKSFAIKKVKSWKEAKSSLQLFDKGDILFGSMRSYLHKVVVAPFDGVTRKTCFVLKPKLDNIHAFATLTMFQKSTIDFSHRHSKGSTMPYAVWKNSMDKMEVVVPPSKILERFEQIVQPMLRSICLFYFKNYNLRCTRDLLLERLVSGKLNVEHLDIGASEPVFTIDGAFRRV